MDSGRWLRAALGALLLAVAPPGGADHIGVMVRQHGEWISGVLIGERPTRYRILTEQVESGSYTELAVDLVEGDCERRFATIDIHLRNPIEQDLKTEDLEGALRVDRYPVHRVFYQIGALAGDMMLHLFLVDIEGQLVFWMEMAAGEAVRFRFPTERKDYHLRFPLEGFTEALERATRLCNQPAAEKDRPYFGK
ncbi:MAG TPA: hypothetical protein VH881_10160 [Burkholderiales bacterium]|jgi:hypothetical protein